MQENGRNVDNIKYYCFCINVIKSTVSKYKYVCVNSSSWDDRFGVVKIFHKVIM